MCLISALADDPQGIIETTVVYMLSSPSPTPIPGTTILTGSTSLPIDCHQQMIMDDIIVVVYAQ